MIGQQDYLEVEYEDGEWIVADSQGVISGHGSRKDAVQEAIRLGRSYQLYSAIDLYDKSGEYIDSIHLAQGQQDLMQTTGEMVMLGGGLMMGVGAIDAMGDMFDGL